MATLPGTEMLNEDLEELQPCLGDTVPNLMSTSLRMTFKLQPRSCAYVEVTRLSAECQGKGGSEVGTLPRFIT